METAWYNLTEKNLPVGSTFQVFCQIVQAPLWTGLPKFSNGKVQVNFGWDAANSQVSILNPFSMKSYSPWVDPPDFALLFKKEADAHECELAANAVAAFRKKDTAEAYRLRSLAEKLLVDRVIKWVRLVDTHTFTTLDAAKHGVLLHTRTSRIVEEGVDRGSVVLLPSAPPTSKISLSMADILRGL